MAAAAVLFGTPAVSLYLALYRRAPLRRWFTFGGRGVDNDRRTSASRMVSTPVGQVCVMWRTPWRDAAERAR